MFPLHPKRAIDIGDSTIDDWLAMQQALGLSRGLFVPSFLHRHNPFADTTPLVHTRVAHAPSRLLQSSDWAHPNYWNPMPNDADQLDMMLYWVPDEATRSRIFVDKPMELLGFPPVAG